MLTPIHLMDQRQQGWIQAAISYYKARVAIYKLMVEEWQEELAALAKCEHGNEPSKCEACLGIADN